MERPIQPISLAGSQLGEVRHLRAFFANDEEEYRVLLPFIREGLFRGGQLSGDAVIDIMRTRPMVIIGGYLQQNPFFTRPEEFLSEFRGRNSGRTSVE